MYRWLHGDETVPYILETHRYYIYKTYMVEKLQMKYSSVLGTFKFSVVL